MTKSVILGKGPGFALTLDVASLLTTRLLVQANSGGGKSWALRRILEQTHGCGAIQIILDREGEFHTLREKFDYILAGKGGDCPADPRSAAMLARRILELRVSCIVDISELHKRDQVRFVKLFLDSLIAAPRALWQPALVVVDEAHKFCPEKDEAESSEAVIDLMTLGRKRGFCGILATQRISKLAKDAAAECNNKLIGRASLDLDTKRAADELGLTGKEAQQSLRILDAGTFYAFGPSISRTVELMKIGPVQTTHPEPGIKANVAPSPPTKKIKAILAKLADLPKEAEAEVRDVAALSAEVRSLKVQLASKAPAPAATPSGAQLVAEFRRGFDLGIASQAAEMAEILVADVGLVGGSLAGAKDFLTKATECLAAADAKAKGMMREAAGKKPALVKFKPVASNTGALTIARNGSAPQALMRPTSGGPVPLRGGDIKPGTVVHIDMATGITLDGPKRRILDAIAWWGAIGVPNPTRVQVAAVAKYAWKGAAFKNPMSSLMTSGLCQIPEPGRVSFTETGAALAHTPDSPPSEEELHRRIISILDGPKAKILGVLLSERREMTREELAEASSYAASGAAFKNPLSGLCSLGFVDRPRAGYVVASGQLFIQ